MAELVASMFYIFLPVHHTVSAWDKSTVSISVPQIRNKRADQ